MTSQISAPTTHSLASNARRLGLAGVSGFAAVIVSGVVMPAYADITNDATASGTYGASTTTSNTSTVNIPVAPAAPALTISKTADAPTTAAGVDATITDAGDTITFHFTVTNTGNVTLTSPTPVDGGVTFNGAAGTGSLGAFSPDPTTITLAPGSSQVFTADYSMSQLDVDRAAGITSGVANSASAAATAPGGPAGGVTTSTNGTATTTIAAGPKLDIVKAGLLTTDANADGKAAVGDVITYTYTVRNIGNVALTGVSVNDTHEGAALPAGTIAGEALSSDGPLASLTPAIVSTDAPTTANDGTWGVLQPGATITFTYVHTVTQAEVDGG